jgi:hypothetical protein
MTGAGSREKPTFAGLAGVAHEQFAKTVGAQHDDDTVLVHIVTGIREERQRRRQHVERYAVSGNPLHPAPGDNDR